MAVGVLGPVQVGDDAGPLGPRLRVVLAALVARRGEVVSPDRLADALWGDDPPESWPKQVQICVMRLRKALGQDAIETTSGGYRLALTEDDVDVCRFERLIERGRVLAVSGQAVQASVTFARALALWRGPPFEDLDGWPPGRSEALRLEELRRGAEEDLLEARLEAGEHRDVAAEAEAAVAAEPLRERRWGILALAQYRCGRQADALRSLRRARQVLRDQLGVDPGPELVALEGAILRHDPSLSVTEAPAMTERSPYKGLAPYDTSDAESFFGRDADVVACVDRLQAMSLLVITGPSGCGKTSLLRAGLMPALTRRGLLVTVLAPGGEPDSELTTALESDRAVIVVDQFEELFALDAEPAVRRSFCARLAAYATDGHRVAIAVRADHLADLAADPTLARLVERGLYLVSPLSGAALRTAIEEPAKQAGLVLEPGLVDLLVRDAEGEPGALPLLSHALAETWRRREGRVLTVEGYRATGGIRIAVARSADRLYESLTPGQRTMLRAVLLRLVATAADGEPIRTRVPMRAIAAEPAWQQVVGLLVRARLVTAEEDSVELAHEALARAWPRLRSWLDEDSAGQRILRHVATAADGWEALGRPDSELYRGARLEGALEWREATRPDLTSLEAEFLDRSAAHQRSELRAAAEQAQRQRRSNRRLKALLTGVGVLLAAAIAAGVIAVRQRERADGEAQTAEARRVAAQALVDRRYDRALLLAVEAVRLGNSDETLGNLLNTIERSPRAAGVIRGRGTRLLDLQLSPAGGIAAVVESDERIALLDTSTGVERAGLATGGVSYRSPVFSPDGRRLAVSSFPSTCWIGVDCERSTIEVFDARTLQSAGVRYEGLGLPAVDIAYSPRGDVVAAVPPLPFAGSTDNIAVWDVDHAGAPSMHLSLSEPGVDRRATHDSGPPGWVRISPDGARLYASGAGPTDVFDLHSGEQVGRFDGEGGLALSPDGRTLAVLTSTTRVGLFDAASGERVAELVGHDDLVTAAAFGPDGDVVATVSNDETVAVWDVSSGHRLHRLEGHAGTVHGVGFSADGSTLYTSAADGAVIAWDLAGPGGLVQQLVAASSDQLVETNVQISPSGDSAAVADLEVVHLVDIASGRVIDLPADSVTWIAYRPDGRRLATVGFDGTTQLWDVRRGSLLATRTDSSGLNYGAAAFAVDGSAVVVAASDGIVTELDGATLEPTGRTLEVGFVPDRLITNAAGLVAVTSQPATSSATTEVAFGDLATGEVSRRIDVDSSVQRAAFSADGTRLAVGGNDGRLAVIDVASGAVVGRQDPVHDGPVAAVAFSPDGGTVATVGLDGALAFADSETATPHAGVQPGPANMQAAVWYEPDGDAVLVAYRDGSVVRFATTPDAWIEHACRVAGRNLTPTEWREIFADRPYRETCPTT